MAFSVSSPSSSLASEIFTPVEEQLSFPFDWHHFLANYLRLLGLDSKAVHKQYHVNIDQDTFKTPNIKGFQIVAHFLLTKLDGERAKKTFFEVWPVHDKKQEAGFRRKVQEWCTEIQSVCIIYSKMIATLSMSYLIFHYFCRITRSSSLI